VKLWEVATGQPERELPGAYGPVAYSPNGRLLAAVDGNRVKLWNTRSWKVVTTLRGAHPPPSPLKTSVWIAQIAFSKDGQLLAAACMKDKQEDVLWDLSKTKGPARKK